MRSNCSQRPIPRAGTVRSRSPRNMDTWRSFGCSLMPAKTQADTIPTGTIPTRPRCIRPFWPDMMRLSDCWSSGERDWKSKTRSIKARRWAGPFTGDKRGSRSTFAPKGQRLRKSDVRRCEVGQTIVFCRLLPRAFGPRNFMKNRCLRWGMLQLANRPEGRGFSTLSGGRTVARYNRPRKAMVCPTRRWPSEARHYAGRGQLGSLASCLAGLDWRWKCELVQLTPWFTEAQRAPSPHDGDGKLKHTLPMRKLFGRCVQS